MARPSLIAAAALLVLQAAVSSQSTAADPFLSRLEGQWNGEGTVLGQPSRIEMEWSWTLNGRFLRLTFRNTMGIAPKTQLFEGHAYYRATGNGRYRGSWMDNSGAIRPIEARQDGEAIVAQWGTPETEVGETTYRLLPGDRMEVIDKVRQKDGAWRDFGRSSLVRR
jgi:hypothetical protein